MICELYLNFLKKGKKRKGLKGQTLITRDPATTPESKESGSKAKGMRQGGAMGCLPWGHFPRPTGLDPAIPTSDEFPKFSEPKSLSAKSREGPEEGGRGLGVTGDPWSWGSASVHNLHEASCSQLFSPLDHEPPEHKDGLCFAHRCVLSP